MMRRARLLLLLPLGACAHAPTYLEGHGYVADREATLGWVLLSVASAVILVMAALVLAAVLRRRPPAAGLARSGGGLRWIVIGGVIVPAVILLAMFSYSMTVLAQVSRPATRPPVTVEVIGHRWWWEVRYPGSAPTDVFSTANEIHIPLHQPVRLVVSTADVIHSFWIPQLAGKTDLIPGQRNVMWLEADTAGSYWGHCGEYCGLQHANMMMTVVAQPAAEYARWAAQQRQPAAVPAPGSAAEGQQVFQRSCALCHSIRGTPAGGAIGPDLTHVASRAMIGAGLLPNTQGNLAGWIANPRSLKPGVVMPRVPLEPRELHAVVSYLQSLH
jgi:cytochrome c oxidase subunit 2